jgi:hypothetical protein
VAGNRRTRIGSIGDPELIVRQMAKIIRKVEQRNFALGDANPASGEVEETIDLKGWRKLCRGMRMSAAGS